MEGRGAPGEAAAARGQAQGATSVPLTSPGPLQSMISTTWGSRDPPPAQANPLCNEQREERWVGTVEAWL